jgi:uncharacterized protein (TIGR03000 family)
MKRWLFTTAAAVLAAAPAAADAPATVTVTVPVGATLTIDGQRTEQMTAVRQFISPPLAAGRTYTYNLQATYTWEGATVSRQRKIEVSAGSSVAVDMASAPAVAAPPAPGTKPRSTAPDTLPGRFDTQPRPSDPKPPKKGDDEGKKVTAADPSETPRSTEAVKPAAAATAPQDKKETQKPEIEVPYVPTPEKVVAEMLKQAAVKEGDTVYDLGCGDGRIVIAAVKDFKAKKGIGIDYNPERVEDSKKAARKAGSDVEKKLEFKQGDVLKMTEKDFEGVDVVTLYLLPEVNLRLKPVLLKGLKPGARVVSHDFHMGDDWKPEKTVQVTDDNGTEHTVYLWTIKEKK